MCVEGVLRCVYFGEYVIAGVYFGIGYAVTVTRGLIYKGVSETGRKCAYASFTANVVIYKKQSMRKSVRSSTHPFTLE